MIDAPVFRCRLVQTREEYHAACRLPLSSAFAFVALTQAGPGMAQTDTMRLAHVSMANQLGAMEYCMDKGWADQAAVDAQNRAAASLPVTADQTGLREAEATGRKRELMTNGTTLAMSAMAQRGGTTEQALCTRMASAAKTVEAQQSSMPVFPGLPGGAAMPTLPPGMTRPTMPGMPEPQ